MTTAMTRTRMTTTTTRMKAASTMTTATKMVDALGEMATTG